MLVDASMSEGKTIRTIRQTESNCFDDEIFFDHITRFKGSYPQCKNYEFENENKMSMSVEDTYCSSCFSLFISYLKLQLQCLDEESQSILESYQILCRENENQMPCYSFLNESLFSEVASLRRADARFQYCFSAPQNKTKCSNECKSLLMDIDRNSTQFGCCAQTLLNSSLVRVDGPKVDQLFSYKLWTACGLQTLEGSCSESTLNGCTPLKVTIVSLIMSAVIATTVTILQ